MHNNVFYSDLMVCFLKMWELFLCLEQCTFLLFSRNARLSYFTFVLSQMHCMVSYICFSPCETQLRRWSFIRSSFSFFVASFKTSHVRCHLPAPPLRYWKPFAPQQGKEHINPQGAAWGSQGYESLSRMGFEPVMCGVSISRFNFSFVHEDRSGAHMHF